jgi:hypothetical protein
VSGTGFVGRKGPGGRNWSHVGWVCHVRKNHGYARHGLADLSGSGASRRKET